MHISNLRIFCNGLAALAIFAASGSATYLEPANFTSLGTLNISNSDNYVFNTTTDILTDTTTASVLYTGVTYNGIAVFDFSSVDLSGGTFTVTGNDPLALLSQTNLTITGSASLSANGGNGGTPTGGTGVGGGGNGGNGAVNGKGSNGVGQGASLGASCGSGGAGFGGAGGASECPSAGGPTYGNLIVQLVGGSGAGDKGGGGAGGGAIELGAATIGGILTISAGGTVSANGGSGGPGDSGGGSGGGIFLHADTVSLSGMDALSVAGGNNDSDNKNGGGGGGAGRIAIQTDIYTNTGTFDTTGGTGNINGGNFTFTGPVTLTPEPSFFALLGTIFVGLAVFRKRCPREVRTPYIPQSGHHVKTFGGFLPACGEGPQPIGD